ncbi:MAG: AraC family transcriptional regulator [Opitutaceae bacterium]|nr:AraC family transcriptional regulator [Opitutaceae bacterium]
MINVSSGGVLHQDGRRFRYEPRTAFVYQPGSMHWIENECAGRQICVGVVGAGAELLTPGVRPCDDELMTLAAMAYETAESNSEFKHARLDFLAGLIVLRLRELAPFDPDLTLSRAERAKAIIDASLDQKLDLDALARSVYLSPRYLRELFQKKFGQSPLHYLIRSRVERSKLLLETTEDTVQAIASECGFASSFYFSRMFKKLEGCSPTDYRERRLRAALKKAPGYSARER